jgi:hypothetical protein
MGLLIPEDIPLDTLPSSEQRVIRMFQEGLPDSWLIIPRLEVVNQGKNYEVDILLINELMGIFAVEVKGGPLEVRQGEWYRRSDIISLSPPRQAHDISFAFRDQLRKSSPLLKKIHVPFAVAMPDIRGLSALGDGLPAGVLREQLLMADDLRAVDGRPLEGAFWALYATDVRNAPLAADQIEAAMNFLRPDQDFRWDPQARAKEARTTLRRITDGQTRALATLDLNERVVVSGPAGSGKTRLAVAWVERALLRGERTLLTCFNEPMAEMLAEATSDNDLLTVGSVQKMLMNLEGFPKLSVPESMSGKEASEWWLNAPFDHIAKHLDEAIMRFDTIVVDEAQDFAPHWFETLESLLVDEGAARLMKLADPQQEVFDRGFILENAGSGVVRADLSMNCRNTHAVARVVARFGGAEAAPASPDGQPVEFYGWSSDDQAVLEVGNLLERLVGEDQIDPANILVVTGHTSVRDKIREGAPGGFVCDKWEKRADGNIVCETIHRTKGLERDAVILVTTDADLPDNLLYVGMSRAISKLIIVGPPALRARLGLGNEEMTSD